MIFKHSVPILYSADIVRSITYYTDILGFANNWTWDDPPTFGGVSKDSVEIFFCKNCQGNPGTWFSIMIDDVDTYYEAIKAKGADIKSDPKTMDWGLREMLVQDPDGHIIRIGQGGASSDREKNTAGLPQTVRIVERAPTLTEMQQLMKAVGWSSPEDEKRKELPLSFVAFALVAEDITNGEVIGCAFVLSDNDSFYYVRNVAVHPQWQGKRVGSAMMQRISDWLQNNARDNSMAWLHSGENLERFYRQFGFVPTFSMRKQIIRDK